MRQSKFLYSSLIMALLFALSALSGVWQTGQAIGTIPTETTPTKDKTRPPKVTKTVMPTPTDQSGGKIGSGGGIVEIKDGSTVWGGIEIPPGALDSEIEVAIFKIPADRLPRRHQMFFQREALQVVFYKDGKVWNGELTTPFTVYFDLTALERYQYDNNPEKVKIYQYDKVEKKWGECSSSFDKDMGAYGRLSCTSTKATFFALGEPSGKKE